MCEPAYQWLYLAGISTFGATTLAMSLLNRFQTVEWRATRATAFAILGCLGVFPYVHMMVAYPHFDKLWEVVAIDAAMGACYLTGAALYALRIPERWAPGRFDIMLHSHQLFHLCVVGGAFCHYLAVLELLRWRDASGGCALELVDRAMVRHAVQGGGDFVDVHAVLEYLQRRLHEYFNLPYNSFCVAPHDSYAALLDRHPMCAAAT